MDQRSISDLARLWSPLPSCWWWWLGAEGGEQPRGNWGALKAGGNMGNPGSVHCMWIPKIRKKTCFLGILSKVVYKADWRICGLPWWFLSPSHSSSWLHWGHFQGLLVLRQTACSGAGDLWAYKKCLGTEEKRHLHIVTTRSMVIWEPVFHKGYATINPTPSAAPHTKLAYTVDTKFFRIPCRYPLGLPTAGSTLSTHI